MDVKKLAKVLRANVPGAERIVRDGMCLFVLCKQSEVDVTPYLREVDTGEYSVCTVKARTSFADEITSKGDVIA